ncbi:uncharacterized protein LOC126390939 [Epinephelus moara]|uniref:uncharacterized protein LOC126390939 n=1 Tax=Epinephelus moara TaxID=300413 RepID=UPI00214E8844|nr:uncharacterized protein LOC126390939 [Epinephelus moara]
MPLVVTMKAAACICDKEKKLASPLCLQGLGVEAERCGRTSTEEPSQNATPDSETEAPVKRRGRPPKTAAAAPAVAEKEGAAAPTGGGAGRGRKRAADPNSNPSAESINIKMSKQQQQNDEGTKRQIDLQRENERVRKWEPGEETGRAAGTVVVLLGSEGDTEIELESSPEGVICGRRVRESNPLTQRQSSFAAWSNTHSQGDTKSTRTGGTKEEIPSWQTTRAQHELAVKRKPVKVKPRL